MRYLLLAVALLVSSTLQANERGTHGEAAQWFKDAKFGIFIHWGIYSVNGSGASWAIFNKRMSYEKYMEQLKGFTASKYDPSKWADLFSEAGAKYAVLTTKHHDGVALWNTQQLTEGKKLFQSRLHRFRRSEDLLLLGIQAAM